MNSASAKVEPPIADESVQARPDPSACDSIKSPELTHEATSHEDTDRRLYRRSVAYFLFGFGYDKNVIITDEP